MLALPGGAYLYQGEELGLPDHTTLPDSARQDPTFARTNGEMRGRDGCRVPIPWEALAPSYGFGPSPSSWLPQPPSWSRYARDVQVGVEDSTLELYRLALTVRGQRSLGRAELTWLPAPPDVLLARVGDVVMAVNLGEAPMVLPASGTLLVASGAVEIDDGMLTLPSDTAVWLTAD